MKQIRLFTILLFIVIALLSCDNSSNVNSRLELQILPLGDSRVQGGRPTHESYRYELWKLLVDGDFVFDFVGNRKDDADYPMHQNLDFDRDHQGTGGARTADILKEVKELDTENMPNLVLLGIGGNDLANGAETIETVVSNINEIIDILQEKNPTINIFLEQIAPGHSSFMNEARWLAFNQFKAAALEISTEQTSDQSLVASVDMTANWSDDYMADNVHYNVFGAKVVASRYMDSIELYFDR